MIYNSTNINKTNSYLLHLIIEKKIKKKNQGIPKKSQILAWNRHKAVTHLWWKYFILFYLIGIFLQQKKSALTITTFGFIHIWNQGNGAYFKKLFYNFTDILAAILLYPSIILDRQNAEGSAFRKFKSGPASPLQEPPKSKKNEEIIYSFIYMTFLCPKFYSNKHIICLIQQPLPLT